MTFVTPILISWLVFSIIGVVLCWALSGHKAFSFTVAFALVALYWILCWCYPVSTLVLTYHLGAA
ncbi:TPA: hypothetical protein ACNEJR_003707 [Escherichia coli]